MRLQIVTPVYNDWECLIRLLQDIETLAFKAKLNIQVLAVNDGSSQPAPSFDGKLTALTGNEQVEILHLIRNLGHQRAIAVGLVEVARQSDADVVIVMDADGEDQPADLIRFLSAHEEQPDHIILAKREKRSEGWVFRFFYYLYKLLFQLLTGARIDFGNFLLIPASRLEQFVYNGDIWNHLAAAIVRARLPATKINTRRGNRYFGQSKMNLTMLVLHGLSAVSVYSDIVFVRLFIASGAVIVLSAISVAIVVGIKLFTDLGIPGWATTATGLLALLAFQAIAFTGSLAFIVLNARSQPFLIPAAEAPKFIKSRESICRHAPAMQADKSEASQ